MLFDCIARQALIVRIFFKTIHNISAYNDNTGELSRRDASDATRSQSVTKLIQRDESRGVSQLLAHGPATHHKDIYIFLIY